MTPSPPDLRPPLSALSRARGSVSRGSRKATESTHPAAPPPPPARPSPPPALRTTRILCWHLYLTRNPRGGSGPEGLEQSSGQTARSGTVAARSDHLEIP